MPLHRRWRKAVFGLTLAVLAGGCLWRRYRRRGVRLVAVPVVRRSLDGVSCLGLTPAPCFPETRLLAPAGLLAFSPAPPREPGCEIEPRVVMWRRESVQAREPGSEIEPCVVTVRREPVPAPGPGVLVVSYPPQSIRRRLGRRALRLADAALYWILQPFVNRRLRLASTAAMVASVLWTAHSAVEPASPR